MAGQSWTKHNTGKKIMFGGVYPAYAEGFTAYKYVKFNQVLSYGINDSVYSGTGTSDSYPVYRNYTGHWSDLKKSVLRWSHNGQHVMMGNNKPLDITDVPVGVVIRGWCQVQGRLTALTVVGNNSVKVFSIPADGLGLTVSWSTFSEDFSRLTSDIVLQGGVCDGDPFSVIVTEMNSYAYLLFDKPTMTWLEVPLISTEGLYPFDAVVKQGIRAVLYKRRVGVGPSPVQTVVGVGPTAIFRQMDTTGYPSVCGPLIGDPINFGPSQSSYTLTTRVGSYAEAYLDCYFMNPLVEGPPPITLTSAPVTVDSKSVGLPVYAHGVVNNTACYAGKAKAASGLAFANVSYEEIEAARQQVAQALTDPYLNYNNDSPPGPTIKTLYVSEVFDVRVTLQWTMQGPPNTNRHLCSLIINGVEKWSGAVFLQIESYDALLLNSQPLVAENKNTIVLFYMQENTIYVANAQFFKIVLNKQTGESSVSTLSAGDYSIMTKQIFLSL